jgi:hypothetical protein
VYAGLMILVKVLDTSKKLGRRVEAKIVVEYRKF